MATDVCTFDHLSARYDRISTLLGTELRAWMAVHLPARGDRAVDLGCGTGVQTELLADRFDEVLAVDLSGPVVEFARHRRPRTGVHYERRDLRDVAPDADGRFDLVFSAYTLHHVELDSALHRIRSLVRPGGQVLLVDVVDDRQPVPRRWFRRQAWRMFAGDLRHRRRPVRHAVELLRLQLDPDWLDHQTSDRLLPPADWDAHCRAVLPGATITPLRRARALDWRCCPPQGRPR
jgi:SAM-dependent methyltransferase